MDFFRIILQVFVQLADKYGFNAATLIVVCYGFWKLGTNHLAHLKLDIKNIDIKVDLITKKQEEGFDELKEELVKIDKRMSIREELCSERHKKES